MSVLPPVPLCAVSYCMEDAALGSPACDRHSKPKQWWRHWHWWARTITLGLFSPVEGTPRRQNDFSTALHEAAHCVTALVLGCPTIGAVLPSFGLPSRGIAGLALFGHGAIDEMVTFEQLSDRHRGDDDQISVASIPTNVRRYLPVLLAGTLAEQRGGFDSDYYTGGYTDWIRASDLAEQVSRAPFYTAKARAVMERAETAAGTIVDQQWPWIVRVARELERKRRLTKQEIVALRPLKDNT